MQKPSGHCVIFDTEYTAWEGSQERQWGGPNEYREIVQIGAVRVVWHEEPIEVDGFLSFVKPEKNPILSEYFVTLTNITQRDIEEYGVDFPSAIAAFKAWVGDTPLYAFGRDGEWVRENCDTLDISCPFPSEQFHNLKTWFSEQGIVTDGYTSGTLTTLFRVEPLRRGHDALNDVRTILDALLLYSRRARP